MSSTSHDQPPYQEEPWAMSSLVIDRIMFVYGPTDQPTDGPTFAKQYTPHFFEGGYNYYNEILVNAKFLISTKSRNFKMLLIQLNNLQERFVY